MHICMIGAGYVGLVSAACFSEFGWTVTCVDKDEARLAELKEGKSPIYELGLDDLLERKDSLPVLLEKHRERMLDERQAGRRFEVAARLFGERVRRVVGRDHVYDVRAHAVAQRIAVRSSLDRGIALDARAEIRVARLIEPQVMDARFGRDALGGDRPGVEERELTPSGQVQNVQPRAVAARETHR